LSWAHSCTNEYRSCGHHRASASFAARSWLLLTLSELSFTVREYFQLGTDTPMSPSDAAWQQFISTVTRPAARLYSDHWAGSGAIGRVAACSGAPAADRGANSLRQRALAAFLGFARAQACNSDTAIAMAQSARARAARMCGWTPIWLASRDAALVSDRPRKRRASISTSPSPTPPASRTALRDGQGAVIAREKTGSRAMPVAGPRMRGCRTVAAQPDRCG